MAYCNFTWGKGTLKEVLEDDLVMQVATVGISMPLFLAAVPFLRIGC